MKLLQKILVIIIDYRIYTPKINFTITIYDILQQNSVIMHFMLYNSNKNIFDKNINMSRPPKTYVMKIIDTIYNLTRTIYLYIQFLTFYISAINLN